MLELKTKSVQRCGRCIGSGLGSIVSGLPNCRPVHALLPKGWRIVPHPFSCPGEHETPPHHWRSLPARDPLDRPLHRLRARGDTTRDGTRPALQGAELGSKPFERPPPSQVWPVWFKACGDVAAWRAALRVGSLSAPMASRSPISAATSPCSHVGKRPSTA